MLVEEVGHGETAAAGSPLSVGREAVPDPQVPERASRRTNTAQYKLDVLAEYDRLDKSLVSPTGEGPSGLKMVVRSPADVVVP
jgi:hypothetical protein